LCINFSVFKKKVEQTKEELKIPITNSTNATNPMNSINAINSINPINANGLATCQLATAFWDGQAAKRIVDILVNKLRCEA